MILALHDNIARCPDFGYGFATVQSPVWDLAGVLTATGGELVSHGGRVFFRMVSTDSRQIEPGDLYVALVGDRFDGHDFLSEVVKKGAAGVVVSRRPEKALPVPVVLVADTLRGLGDLARYRRQLLPRLKVAAITGSSGKTTVKDMLAAILSGQGAVLKTTGNFNNLVGLPLSLLPVDYRHRHAVLEMGMNRPGEIARLAEIAQPDVACITNIQPAHLEGVGSIAGVAKAKGELFAGMGKDGVLAVNLDDFRVKRIAAALPHAKVTFGRDREAMVRGLRAVSKDARGVSFTLRIAGEERRVSLRALGGHMVTNALAAAAMAHGLGLDLAAIVAGLAAYEPAAQRMQPVQLANGVTVVNDTYNANPGSTAAALKAIAAMRGKGRIVAVLGDMLELGDGSAAEHRKIGGLVARSGFDRLFACGGFAAEVAAGALGEGMRPEQVLAGAKEEAASELRRLLANGAIAAGDLILVKGSRGMRMETLVAELVTAGSVG